MTVTCIEDLRVLHKRRVPKMFYDYAESGSWTERTFRRNEEAFTEIRLRQRVANMPAHHRGLVAILMRLVRVNFGGAVI